MTKEKDSEEDSLFLGVGLAKGPRLFRVQGASRVGFPIIQAQHKGANQ